MSGYSLIELLIVVILVGLLAALTAPVAGKLIRRSEDMAALSSARQVLAMARLESVRRTSNVVVAVSTVSPSDKRIHLLTFQDLNGNYNQDSGEPVLGDVTLSPRIHFWKQGGGEDDVADAIHFDTYITVSSPTGDTSLTDRIVFLPTGGISPPQDSGSGPITTSGGRGIYFADWQGKNYFRVTVESDLSGKPRVDKYVQGSGYVTSGWRWQ